MLAPCGRSAYLSTRCAYAWNDTAVTSYLPSRAARFSVSMSASTWSTTMPPVSTAPLARPKNMNASSESGLWATVMRWLDISVQYTGPPCDCMSETSLAILFFLQLAVILVVCRAVGWLGQRVGQPQVIGEMVAGFLMGPSFFAWVAPAVHAQIFPPHSLPIIFVVSQLGLVLFMFCMGLEFRNELLLKHVRRAAAVSSAGIIVPLA